MADDDAPELPLLPQPPALPDLTDLILRLEELILEAAALVSSRDSDAAAFYQKLLRAQFRAQAIQATRKFPNNAKKYASAADIVQPLRQLLLEEGLVLTASAVLIRDPFVRYGQYPSGDPKETFRSEVLVTYTLTDSATGFEKSWTWPGVSNDPGDFGARHAEAAARKPFLLNLLFTYTTEEEPPPALGVTHSDAPPTGSATGSGPENLPAASSSSSAPKSSPDPGPTVEDMKDRAKALRDRFQVWEIEAVIRVLEVPDDREIWATGHYQLLLDEFGTGEAIRVTRAIQDMAKAEPASDDQRAQLDRLVGGKKNIRATMRAEIASAKASGWTWALDYWIKKLQAT